MARPATEEGRSESSSLLCDLLAHDPERIEFTLRLTLICTLTLLVVEIYGTPDPALTVYISFFLNKPDRTTSLIMNVAFVIVISLLLGFVLSIARQVVDEPMTRVAAMALVSFALMFLTSASKLKPLGAIAALVTVYALALLGDVPVGELATRGLLYGWLFIGIPAGVSLLVNLLIAPAPRRLAERTLAQRLCAASRLLQGTGAQARQPLARARDKALGLVLQRLRLTGIERTASAVDLAMLGEAAYRAERLLLLAHELADRPDLPDAWRTSFRETLAEMAAAFRKGGYPINIALAGESTSTKLSHDTAVLMRDAERTLAQFTVAPPDVPLHFSAEARSGFFVPDAFTNPIHVQYALKVTGAAMACYLIYSLLDWNGIHTALITCYIVSLGTAAETIEKLALRIAGCLAGAAAGLVTLIFILPALDSIGQLMALVFLATLPAAWVAAGSPRVSYAGFQFAFAFFLCVIQGAAPAFDLAIARDRVIGILLGNFMSYLFLTALWPVSIGQRIDPAIAALLRTLSSLAQAGDRARQALIPAFEAALTAVREDLHLLRYEPARLRGTPEWIARRRAAVEDICALEGPILLVGDNAPELLNHAAKRLDWLADRLAGRETGVTGPLPADPIRTDLAVRMEGHLHRLDEELAPAHG